MNNSHTERQHATDLLGHSEEEVAVSALLCPCPHEARLGAGRFGAELHGAFSFSSSSPCTAAAAPAPAAGSGRGLACPLSISFSPHHTASHIQLCLLRLPAEKRGKGGGQGSRREKYVKVEVQRGKG